MDGGAARLMNSISVDDGKRDYRTVRTESLCVSPVTTLPVCIKTGQCGENTVRIMILGAGIFQVPYIRLAQEMGLDTVVVSISGDYPGIPMADHYVELSTTDTVGVLNAARTWEISAICTGGTDVSVPTLAQVAEALSLPAVSPQAAVTISSKALFRQFLHDNQLPCPKFCSGRTFESIAFELETWNAPMVFKPEDSSGSRGVGILDEWNAAEARKRFEYAQGYSRSGVVCAETFVEGVEVGGDGFMQGGRLAFSVVTHKHMDGLLVRGHSLPTNITPEQEQRVCQAVERTCAALGYPDGPVNFDVIVNEREVFILEMGARTGGNGIADLIELATGVNVYRAVLEFATGQTVSVSPEPTRKGCGTMVFGSASGGILRGVASLDTVRRHVPEVCRMQLAVPPGARIEPLIHNANIIGYAAFHCPAAQDYDRICRALSDLLELEVEDDRAS